MRALLWTSALLLPALCLAQVQISNSPKNQAPAARVMAIEPTQQVDFEGSLSQLRQRLQLTDAQAPAWARFAASVQAYSNQFFQEAPPGAFAAEAAPRQVEHIANTLQNRLTALRAIERQAQALYAALNPQQQKTADQHLVASIPVFGNSPPSLR